MNPTAVYSKILNSCATKEKINITHTRIGDVTKNIYPGKYSIPEDKAKVFMAAYYEHVIVKGNNEYLTETQRVGDNDTPVLIDLDFRYDPSIQKRQHNDGHVVDILELYMNEIVKMFYLPDDTSIHAYVFEKPTVNTNDKKVTKDGIHIVLGIGMNHIYQIILRQNVIENINDVLQDLPLKNTYDDVFDKGISEGHTNWQLYGSRKPGHDAYKLAYHYEFTYDEDDHEFTLHHYDTTKKGYVTKNLFNQISARYTQPYYEAKIETQNEAEKIIEQKQSKSKMSSLCNNAQDHVSNIFEESDNIYDVIKKLDTVDALRKYAEEFIDNLPPSYYKLKDCHKYTKILPASYADDRNKWIRLGWALHNCSKKMFFTWMYFSSNSDKFEIVDMIGYYEEWKNFKPGGVTMGSIVFWAKTESPDEYKEIQETTMQHLINESIKTCSEWDIANVLFHHFKDEFRCADPKRKIWFRHKKNNWKECPENIFRYEISNTLSRRYTAIAQDYQDQALDCATSNTELSDKLKKKSGTMSEIAIKLKTTNFKQNVLKESSEIFYEYDPYFLERLDQDPYLIGFTNGVFDFKTNEFRKGRPDDYVSMSTRIKYQPIKPKSSTQQKIKEEIEDFMNKIFPDAELRQYMYEHLASVLIGTNKNQTFNIYNGSGCNGKSKIVELMEASLGDYYSIIPTSILTNKRGQIGSLSPELAKLKGVRYAIMQEPSKGESNLNEGVMKEMSGGDTIMANPKFKDPIQFKPQFKLAVCTNTLFKISSNDDGTWRRIRLIDFVSRFVDEDGKEKPDPEKNIFIKDLNINKRFDDWKEVFVSMLIEVSKEKQGEVKDCDAVLKSSREYRMDQDLFTEFINECVIERDAVEIGIEPNPTRDNDWHSGFNEWLRDNNRRYTISKKDLKRTLTKTLCMSEKEWKLKYRLKTYDDIEKENQQKDIALLCT